MSDTVLIIVHVREGHLKQSGEAKKNKIKNQAKKNDSKQKTQEHV